MAELDVQPKQSRPWWIWLLLALIVIGLIALLRGCNKDDNSVTGSTDSTADVKAVTLPEWDNVNFNASEAHYEEITDTSIAVKGDDNYTIYGLGENILFASGENQVQQSAEKQLKQISASLEKRFKGVALAVYGNTDSTGSAGLNKELGKERAESVKQWLVKNAGFSADMITVMSKGETDPVATNQTASGRHMNRRVEIVAKAK
ncbi:OmpA family protein [Dyadobacter bucti]|uniref:OmpA family protein n=1 Tax=Dyadobacter bucti TaxID=2572203 RepID=UPI001109C5B4|nr:OmpA family protein [Dyadobacter bucti]